MNIFSNVIRNCNEKIPLPENSENIKLLKLLKLLRETFEILKIKIKIKIKLNKTIEKNFLFLKLKNPLSIGF
mgnify:CR=1 FL=1